MKPAAERSSLLAPDLEAEAKDAIELEVGRSNVEVRYDRATETAEALVGGKPVPAFTGYWFAWYAFHPDTRIWGEMARPRAAARPGDPRVAIVEHEGSWADLSGVGAVGEIDGAGGFFMIRGSLENRTRSPIEYVRLSYELVNDAGEVVLTEHGYNRRAESLREESFEAGKASTRDLGVEPIPPSGTESFRMFFFRDEVPPFTSYRVRVEEIGSQGSPPNAAPARGRNERR